MSYVFTYGTLMKNRSNHELLENNKFIGDAILKGYAVGDVQGCDFPVIIPKENYEVMGEVYEISEKDEKRLDMLEGVNEDHGLYVKVQKEVQLFNEEKIEVLVYSGEGEAKAGKRITNIKMEGKWNTDSISFIIIDEDDDYEDPDDEDYGDCDEDELDFDI